MQYLHYRTLLLRIFVGLANIANATCADFSEDQLQSCPDISSNVPEYDLNHNDKKKNKQKREDINKAKKIKMYENIKVLKILIEEIQFFIQSQGGKQLQLKNVIN